mgnify:CR=1 FL=1
MKLLHLVLDDKFTYSACDNFNKFESVDNSWVVIASGDLTYLKGSEFKKVSAREALLPDFKKFIKDFDFVIVHSLSKEHCDIVNGNPHNYLWVGMGFDYYEYINIDIYLSFSKRAEMYFVFKQKVKLFLSKFLKLNFGLAGNRYRAINLISHFAPVLPGEYSGVKRIFNHLKYVEWNYGSGTSLLSNNLELKSDAGSILIGNSSDPSNNHYEVIEMLSSLNVADRDIILPLSYGSVSYKKKLLNKIKTFDDFNFQVLEGFMPKEKYFDLLSDCGVVIMNHIRQQAGANISVMLFMGAKVFLNSKSPFYDLYKSKGAVIYSTDDMVRDPELLNGRLDSKSILLNRSIVNGFSKREAIDRKTELLIDTLRGFKASSS